MIRPRGPSDRRKPHIDVDVSAITKGEKSPAETSEALYQELIDVANGKITFSEVLGNVEIAISRKSVWPVA